MSKSDESFFATNIPLNEFCKRCDLAVTFTDNRYAEMDK